MQERRHLGFNYGLQDSFLRTHLSVGSFPKGKCCFVEDQNRIYNKTRVQEYINMLLTDAADET